VQEPCCQEGTPAGYRASCTVLLGFRHAGITAQRSAVRALRTHWPVSRNAFRRGGNWYRGPVVGCRGAPCGARATGRRPGIRARFRRIAHRYAVRLPGARRPGGRDTKTRIFPGIIALFPVPATRDSWGARTAGLWCFPPLPARCHPHRRLLPAHTTPHGPLHSKRLSPGTAGRHAVAFLQSLGGRVGRGAVLQQSNKNGNVALDTAVCDTTVLRIHRVAKKPQVNVTGSGRKSPTSDVSDGTYSIA
jgi:hypothetical protein